MQDFVKAIKLPDFTGSIKSLQQEMKELQASVAADKKK